MATFEESSVEFERDLRHAQKDVKRAKDSTVKWSYGVRPLYGSKHNLLDWQLGLDTPAEGTKFRPMPRGNNGYHPKTSHNIVKTNRASYWMPPARVRSHANASEEIGDASSRSLADLRGVPLGGAAMKGAGGVEVVSADAAAAARVLYSFDNTDSPPPALSLDVFVKPNVRETEKLVEKEYEVLDDNGDALKGRKARSVLRKAASNSGSPPAGPSTAAPGKKPLIEVLDDEEFELV